jgi:hypothetical protein
MNIIQSCWTAPMTTSGQLRWNITNQIETNLWLYGYSVDYLQMLGINIDLYTDSYGATIFNCLPYKNIYTTLDELNDTVNPRFWSAGKIVALREAPLGTVHIDGDVFLKKQAVLDALDMTGHDCIVQMAERMSVFMASYADVLPMFQEAIGDSVSGFTYNLTEAVNAGVLGFNNQRMKDDFINGYNQILNLCQADQKFMSLLKYDVEKKIEPNVVIEQYYLKSLSNVAKYSIKNLLELNSDDFNDDWQTMNQQANELGFAHAWGSSKYGLIPVIKEVMKDRNPQLYQAILDKISDINNI